MVMWNNNNDHNDLTFDDDVDGWWGILMTKNNEHDDVDVGDLSATRWFVRPDNKIGLSSSVKK